MINAAPLHWSKDAVTLPTWPTDTAAASTGEIMKSASKVVFLLDVDNTLLDTGCFLIQLKDYLQSELGPENSERYWSIFEALRDDH